MEYQRRRGRRGRGNPFAAFADPNNSCTLEQPARQWYFTNSIISFLVMSSLIGVIYLMLDYHCHACGAKCDMSTLTKSVEQIAQNLSLMKDSYQDLEIKISHISQELPKLEQQIAILEALANTMVQKGFGWDPKTSLTLPTLDVLLKKSLFGEERNNSSDRCLKYSKCLIKPVNRTIPKKIVNQD